MVAKIKLAVIFVVVISVLVGTGFGAYYLTKPTAPPLPRVPQNLEITSYGGYMIESNGIEFFVVGGTVLNNLTTNTDSVNITVTYYDAMNNTLGTRLSHSAVEIIQPEHMSPFEVYLLLSSNNTDVPHHFNLTALGFPTNKEPFIGVEILNETVFETYDPTTGYYNIVGEVSNSRIRRAYPVTVICAYHDWDDNILALSRAYVAPRLAARTTVPFQLSSEPHEINPASYELFVTVHHYEMVLFQNYVFLAILISAFVIFIFYMKKRRGW